MQNLTNVDIAELAELNYSIIYHYFKNKTDLLFYAAGKSIKKRTEELEWHLQGIREPISRLSKLIWLQLQYHDDQPEYARFIFFKCSSNNDFIIHDAIRHFVRWANILNTILCSGIDQGYFSKDLHSEGIYNEHFYQSRAYEDFEAYLGTIDTILVEGEKTGHFRIGVNKRIFKNLFLGAFSNIVLRLTYPCSELRLAVIGKYINETVSLLLRAVVFPKGNKE